MREKIYRDFCLTLTVFFFRFSTNKATVSFLLSTQPSMVSAFRLSILEPSARSRACGVHEPALQRGIYTWSLRSSLLQRDRDVAPQLPRRTRLQGTSHAVEGVTASARARISSFTQNSIFFYLTLKPYPTARARHTHCDHEPPDTCHARDALRRPISAYGDPTARVGFVCIPHDQQLGPVEASYDLPHDQQLGPVEASYDLEAAADEGARGAPVKVALVAQPAAARRHHRGDHRGD